VTAGVWPLSVRLALRELRGGLAGFRVFVLAIALGVAAIAAVDGLGRAVTGSLQSQARAILGGDLELQLVQRPPSDDEAGWLRQNARALSRTVEMRAMASPLDRRDGRTMVELKTVDAAYPLVGTVEVDAGPDAALADALARRDGVWGAVAEPALLARLGLQAGERVRVGETQFEIRAAIAREPDRGADVVRLGPRLMIAEAALADTGLVQPGSLVRYAVRVLLPAGTAAETWTEAANSAFPQAGWRIRGAADASPGVERFVGRLALFLGFAGLAALLIGGLGVGNAVRHYLDGKSADIATMKCLGAPGALVVRVYLLQIMAIAALGAVLGAALGTALQLAALQAVAAVLPVPITTGVDAVALLTAAALGLLTAAAFALWPLGRAREVPAANLFRHAVAGIAARPRLVYGLAAAACAVALVGATILFSSNRPFTAGFVAAAIAVILILRLAALGVTAGCRRVPPLRSAVARIAIGGLSRPGAPTTSVILSLGAGLTVLVAVTLIEASIRAQIVERLPERVPAIFFIDIQGEQAAPFDTLVREAPGVGDLRRVPALRGRITAIGGVPVEQAAVAPEAAWAVRGDRALTWARALPEDARITAGTWWPDDYAGPPLLSLDAGLARGFGVGVGDTLTLNVLGRDLVVTIGSLREIEWRAVPFDFALILSPGTLEGAPQTSIAAVYAAPGSETALEKAVGDRFDNITAIRTREALEAVQRLVAQIGWGARVAAAVTLAAGTLVLAGAVAADRRRRRYEAVLFKVLGASRRRIASIYAVEYGLLGAVTAGVATALGTAAAWAVVTGPMDFEWAPRLDLALATVMAATTLTLVIGFAGTWRALRRKVGPELRNE